MTKVFDPTKPAQTRDGRAARIICTDRQGQNHGNIVALVGHDDTVYTYRSDGKWAPSVTEFNPNDLVNVPEKESTWQRMNNYGSLGAIVGYKLTDRPESTIGWLRRDYEDGVFVKAEFEPYVKKENN